MSKIKTRPPNDAKQVVIKKPREKAGGPTAVLSSMRHVLPEVGLAKGTKALLNLNQKSGFDCPGCAWPDPEDERATTEFCENGAKAIAEESTQKRITPVFFKEHSVQALSELSDFELGKSGRLTHPMHLGKGATHYQAISWDEAFSLIAKHLQNLNSANEAIFYTSGRTSNEAAFLYQLLVRMYGTNNFPDCSNMCHESSGVALYESVGNGKGSVTLDDFNHADAIFVIGQNPGTNHPRMLSTLQKAARRGCQIVSINPLKEAGTQRFAHPQEVQGFLGVSTPLASIHVPIKINGDVALMKGIAKRLLKTKNGINQKFIEKYTVGFADYCRDIESTSWSEITEKSGIPIEQIKEIAEIYASSKSIICCWAMGLTQHKNAVANIQSVVNLLLMGGHFGRKGAGVCPVRGHSNVQGDRSMGITERPRTVFLQNLEREFDFTAPQEHGFDTIGAIQAMHTGQAKVFFAMGGNFLSASPDTDYTAQALQNCHLTVQVSTKLNRSHLVAGREALILPCLGRTEIDMQNGVEQFVTVENSMGIVHSSRGHMQPASSYLKSEASIVAGLAEHLLPEKAEVFTELSGNYTKIRERISRVVPGFENMNERLKSSAGFALYHSVRDDLIFNTPSEKAHFTVHDLDTKQAPSGKFLMMTIRSHDQFNTTIYGLDDRYRGIHSGRHVVLMNRKDMSSKNLVPGEYVDLRSEFNGQTREVKGFRVAAYDIPKGCIATYFPEANPLISIEDFADKSHTPSSKSVIVSVDKSS